MNKKMFIFDLDGVLVDACDWHRDALNNALLKICNYKISLEEHNEIFNGIPTSKKLTILSKMKKISTEDHKAINDLKQKFTIEAIEKQAYRREEKIDMIKQIKEKGHTVCCYTNSIRKTANLMLKKTGIYEMLDFVLTNQDVSNPKPDPEGYVFLMNKFNFSKENTFIVEDSPKGILAAKNSGANVIEVKNADEVSVNIIRKIL
tara:strand:+ start:969 stop:1580 length:612 start_codon:yes stop_codon:yes gene_type:complete